MPRINPTLDFKRVQPLDVAHQRGVTPHGGASWAVMMSLPVVMWGAGCDFSQMCFGAAGVLGSISAIAFWKLRQMKSPRPTHPISGSLQLRRALAANRAYGVLAQGDSAERSSGRVVDMVDLGGNYYVCPEDVVSKNLDT